MIISSYTADLRFYNTVKDDMDSIRWVGNYE